LGTNATGTGICFKEGDDELVLMHRENIVAKFNFHCQLIVVKGFVLLGRHCGGDIETPAVATDRTRHFAEDLLAIQLTNAFVNSFYRLNGALKACDVFTLLTRQANGFRFPTYDTMCWFSQEHLRVCQKIKVCRQSGLVGL